MGKQKLIGEILIDKGLITIEQLNQALEEQRRTKEFIGAILLKKNWLKEKDFLEALAERFHLGYTNLKYQYIDWSFVKQFSASVILDYKCFPVQRDDSSITIAITNPLDAWVIKKAEEQARGFKLKLVLVSESDMREAILRYRQYLQGNVNSP